MVCAPGRQCGEPRRDVERSNVIADTPGGREDRTVVVGAHLDSVAEGPGINDNGRGTATRCSTSRSSWRSSTSGPQTRCVSRSGALRKCGLFGSKFYVDNLTRRTSSTDITLNLNFDMVGSPNFVRFVYDGDGSAIGVDRPRRLRHDRGGLHRISSHRRQDWPAKRRSSTAARTTWRSSTNDIPAGGLFSGAEGIRTPEQADNPYGG